MRDSPAEIIGRTRQADLVPRVVGPIRRPRPVEVRDVQFLRANTDRAIKITLPGPFTLSRQAQERVLQRRGRAGDGLSPPPSTRRSAT